MWKLLGWPLAFVAAVGAYWLDAQGHKRERVLQDQLQIQQQLVAQVSNRLTVVEAQFNIYRAKQERDAKEAELRAREREAREPEHTNTPRVATDHAAPASRPQPEVIDGESSEAASEENRTRRNNNPGRSIGNGINTIIDRLRDGLNN